MDDKLDIFFQKLDEIERGKWYACSIDSPSQRGHDCFYLQRSLDGKETKYDYAYKVLEELLYEKKIDQHDR
jgi:hypothetical protein